MQHAAMGGHTLQYTVVHCNTCMYVTAFCLTIAAMDQYILVKPRHCTTLHHTATHRNTRSHTTPHCNTYTYVTAAHILCYGVALISRLLKNIGLFGRIQSLL